MRGIRRAIQTALLLLTPLVGIAAPNLDGLWFETDNYPASSVLRFERFGGGWVGKYVQVSPAQQSFGFAVGEVVIRGTLEGAQFKGQVLLKSTASKFECPGLTIGWVPIQMTVVGSDRLQGAWLQTYVDRQNGCTPIGEIWQRYWLERLQTGQEDGK